MVCSIKLIKIKFLQLIFYLRIKIWILIAVVENRWLGAAVNVPAAGHRSHVCAARESGCAGRQKVQLGKRHGWVWLIVICIARPLARRLVCFMNMHMVWCALSPLITAVCLSDKLNWALCSLCPWPQAWRRVCRSSSRKMWLTSFHGSSLPTDSTRTKTPTPEGGWRHPSERVLTMLSERCAIFY